MRIPTAPLSSFLTRIGPAVNAEGMHAINRTARHISGHGPVTSFITNMKFRECQQFRSFLSIQDQKNICPANSATALPRHASILDFSSPFLKAGQLQEARFYHAFAGDSGKTSSSSRESTMSWLKLLNEKIPGGGEQKQNCQDVAYAIYRYRPKEDQEPLGEQEQLEFARKLDDLVPESSDALLFCTAKFNEHSFGTRPSEAIMLNKNLALASPYLISFDAESTLSRLSIIVSPSDALAVVKQLMEAKEGEFEDAFSSIKIAAPGEQGVRCESVIVYFYERDLKQAEQLAHRIKDALPNAQWSNTSPLGMHKIDRGFAYGEVLNSSWSFGRERAQVLAEVMSELQKNPGVSGDKLLKQTLETRGYNPDAPAFVMGTGN